MSEAAEWEEKCHAGKQRKYWKNTSTGKTTWNEPFVKAASGAVVKASASKSAESTSAGEWEEKFSVQHKKKYWKNKITGKTSWKEPPHIHGEDQTKMGLAESLKKTASAPQLEISSSAGDDTVWEWEEKFHAGKQRKYWKNKQTGKSTWTEPPRPDVPLSSLEKSETEQEAHAESRDGGSKTSPWGEDWSELYSAAKKRKYWKNLKTGKSQWSEPPRERSGGGDGDGQESESAAHWEPLQSAEQFSILKEKHSELCEQYGQLKEKYIEIQSALTDSRREADDLRSAAHLSASCSESSYADMESKIEEYEEKVQQLTASCDLYRQNQQEAESRFLEAQSKEILSAADIASLQEQHENSVRKLNAELEINIIREKTKGESSLFEVTRELNEVMLRNDALELKCSMAVGERDELTQKITSLNAQMANIANNRSDKDSVYNDISVRNQQLLDEVSNLEGKIADLNTQSSSKSVLLDEYKRSNAEMTAKFAEEKVKLTLQLDSNIERGKLLEDKFDEADALNHKLIIERDLLKQLNEEADSRQAARLQEASRLEAQDREEEVASLEDAKLEFSNKIRRLNAEVEIKLLEERAAGEKAVLDVTRELNDLKTLHEYLNSRYTTLSEEKKMLNTEMEPIKQQNRDLRAEKEKLVEALHLSREGGREETDSAAGSPLRPPPPPVNGKHLEEERRYEAEAEELKRKCQQAITQRDAHKSSLHLIEAEKALWEESLEEKEGSIAQLKAENEMYRKKYEESEIRFHVWENESESKGKIWTQSMKELQMLHESQTRKMTVEFEIQILEERSKGEQKLFSSVSKLNSLKVVMSQQEAESNIRYDSLRAEKEGAELALQQLKEKHQEVIVEQERILAGTNDAFPHLQIPTPRRAARISHNDADILKSQLFTLINRIDHQSDGNADGSHSTPPDSPLPDDGPDVVYSCNEDTPPNSPPPSDDEQE